MKEREKRKKGVDCQGFVRPSVLLVGSPETRSPKKKHNNKINTYTDRHTHTHLHTDAVATELTYFLLAGRRSYPSSASSLQRASFGFWPRLPPKEKKDDFFFYKAVKYARHVDILI